MDTNRLSDIARECCYAACSSLHFCNAHALCDTLGGRRCNRMFSSDLCSFENKRACCAHSEIIHDVLENVFHNFFTCSGTNKSTSRCVSKSCVIVTLPALYTVSVVLRMS